MRKTSSQKDVKKAYSVYSSIYSIFEGPFLKKARNRSLELLEIKKSDKILEIGFGTGITLKEFVKIVDGKGKVYGIDLTPEMVEKARKRIGGKADLREGSATKLPYKDNMFEIVYLSNILEILSDKDIYKVLSEIKRVLKPNGKVCIVGTSNKKNKTLKVYLWLHNKFPSYTSDPINPAIYLKKSEFKILKEEDVAILGIYHLGIVIGKK